MNWAKLKWMLHKLLRLGVMQQHMLSVAAMRHREALFEQPKYADPRRLTRSEHKVYSQHGEDGILAEIFRRIGVTNRRFVEVGVAPLENNTLYLLNQGWQGLWIDGDLPIEKMPAWIAGQVEVSNLKILSRFVTRENIAGLLAAAGTPRDFDFLSLDVDMNTYALWEGLAEFRPRVVAVEYNASFPPEIDWRVEYRADAVWDGSNYFGASLRAFQNFGEKHGYKLVGSDLSGANAFFVREELAGEHFMASGDAALHYEPSRSHLYLDPAEWKPGVGPI